MDNTVSDVHPSRVGVLDNGWIELIDTMPHFQHGAGDITVVNAARTSYQGTRKSAEDNRKLLHYLYKNKHTTPFEMVELKFRIKLPLFVRDQWVRHRTWSYNIQSFRYSKPCGDYYTPDKWRKQSQINKQDSYGGLSESDEDKIISAFYDKNHMDIGTFTIGTVNAVLNQWLKFGMDFYDALTEAGVGREQARIFIPTNAYTIMIAKVDLHNLLKFLRLRMAKDAQWETRQYALSIYNNFIKTYYPWTAEAFELYTLTSNT